MTYLVMECHPAYAIVLDRAGRVIRVANMGYEQGQKVEAVMALRCHPVTLRMRLAPLAAAACILLALFGGWGYGAFFIPYGTVRLQINPDVMMSVSYMDRVVGLRGLNEDGTRLIGQEHFKGENAEKMSEILVGRAVDLGYLKEGGTVSLQVRGSALWKEKRESSISAGLDHMLEGRIKVGIKVVEGKNGGALGNRKGVTDPSAAKTAAKHLVPLDYPVAAPAMPEGTGWEVDGDGRDDGAYEIEVLINGVAYEADLNAVTGTIVDIDRDDDDREDPFDQNDDLYGDDDDYHGGITPYNNAVYYENSRSHEDRDSNHGHNGSIYERIKPYKAFYMT